MGYILFQTIPSKWNSESLRTSCTSTTWRRGSPTTSQWRPRLLETARPLWEWWRQDPRWGHLRGPGTWRSPRLSPPSDWAGATASPAADQFLGTTLSPDLKVSLQTFISQNTFLIRRRFIKTCDIICSPRIKVQIINGFCFNIAAFTQQLARIGNYVSQTII